MYYPEEFQREAMELYPDWEELHRDLKKGSLFVGPKLFEKSSSVFEISDILNAKTLEQLQKQAELILHSAGCNVTY